MATSNQAPKLIPSRSFQTSSTPLRTSKGALGALYHSAPADSSSYILNIASLGPHYAVATSSPENAIHIVDSETLKFVGSLDGGGGGEYNGGSGAKRKGNVPARQSVQAHEGGVTCLKTFGADKLISCGREGDVVIWDTRTGAAGVKMNAFANGKTVPFLSCDISSDGWTVAAGSELQDDAIIAYWDPRNPAAPSLTHTSTHSDDITVVSFAPAGYSINDVDPSSEDADMGSVSQGSAVAADKKLLLLTGSTDGLLNISDANEKDEDEAVLLTANWGCSIAQAGWVGNEGVWAGSDMETFSTWTSNFDPVSDFDIRAPGAHTEKVQWVTDYLITCYSSPTLSASPRLRVFVGSNEGDAALITTKNPLQKAPSRQRGTSKLAPWYLHNNWTHQHVGVVRALLYDEKHGVIVTGGEDANLHIWRDPNSGSEALYEGDGEDAEMDVDDEATSRYRPAPRDANSRKRDLGPDVEDDDAMDGKRRRR